jgi:vacuolar protein sorting-associated protein 13A/C
MKAPLILVPQNSRSNNILMADFGTLEISNSFAVVGRRGEGGVPAVADKMKILLTSLKLSR